MAADPYTLTMAAFLALAGQCGDGIAPTTLADLQAHESGFRTIAININGKNGGTVKHIKNKAQAVAYAKLLYARGVNFDAGVAQINSGNFKWLGLTPETVFDPCQAIAAQARLLRSYSRYNTGSPERGFANGYVGKIVAGKPAVREAMRAAWGQQASAGTAVPLPTTEAASGNPDASLPPPPAAPTERPPIKLRVPEYP